MKKIRCEIEGIAPLLQNRFRDEEHGQNVTRQKKKIYVPEEEAEKALHKSKDGIIYEPSEHILGSLIKSSTNFKYEGKKSFKDVVKAGILIEPDAIPLLNNDSEKPYETWDEIDARSVVIQRSRVMRWRPKFNKWKLNFSISILNEEQLSVHDLKEILDYAGKFGIGDYRPRFGRFTITKYEEIRDE